MSEAKKLETFSAIESVYLREYVNQVLHKLPLQRDILSLEQRQSSIVQTLLLTLLNN